MLWFPSVIPYTMQLPPGWERGYCENTTRYFYFNPRTGKRAWNIQEVLVSCERSGKVRSSGRFSSKSADVIKPLDDVTS